ncbi:MAG: TolC family protein [Cytophagales bacterium]|nr:TolC family protein [Cytophagales bacterium]
MRQILLSIIITASFSLYAQQDMTLQECIDYALVNNEQGKVTSLEKEIAAAEVRKTIGIGLPQVDVNTGLNYNFQPQQSLVDISNFSDAPPGTEEKISFAQDYDGNIALGIKQLIFDGSFFVGLQASRTYQQLSTKEHIKTEIDIMEAVSKAYYTVLINEERVELLQKNFDRLESLLDDTKAMNESGFAEKIDVDRIRVNFSNLKVEINKLDRFTDLSRKLLKFQMGMPLEEEMQLGEALNDLSPELVTMNSDFNYGDRIEFSQMMTTEDLAKLEMKNNRVQYLPKIYASLNYGYNTATSDIDLLLKSNRWLNFGTVGVSVSIPVFSGFIKSNTIQQNQIKLKQISARKEMLKKSIDLEIQQSSISLNSNVEGLQVQRQNMKLAEEIYDITQIKYTEGVGSNLEVMNADAALKEAQTNYYNALYEAVIARIELKKSLGTLNK